MAGKATELQWFMFENQVRDLIKHVIEPLDTKNDKLTQKCVQIGMDFEKTSKRLSEIEFIMDGVKKQA